MAALTNGIWRHTSGRIQQFTLPTAKIFTRDVLPKCQDKFGYWFGIIYDVCENIRNILQWKFRCRRMLKKMICWKLGNKCYLVPSLIMVSKVRNCGRMEYKLLLK